MRILALALVCAAALIGRAATPAMASGTLSVWLADGTAQQYSGVTIRYVSHTLRVTSADGKGTFIINRAACSYNGQVQVCLPDKISIEQGGSTKPIDMSHGTVYANLTDENRQLPNSNQQIPPRGIVMSITTKIGTIVNLTGTIDEVQK